jgi:hypothetical protein
MGFNRDIYGEGDIPLLFCLPPSNTYLRLRSLFFVFFRQKKKVRYNRKCKLQKLAKT